MKILAFTKYSYTGPSSRYRFYNYQNCFNTYGIDMIIKPLVDDAYFTTDRMVMKMGVVLISYLKRIKDILNILIKNKYDMVLIEYELLPFFPALFEKLFKKRGVVYIVDYDDAIFHKYDLHRSKVVRFLFADKIAIVMQNAKSVIVCNSYLERYARKNNTSIYKLPTVVQLEKYIHKMKNFQQEEKKHFIIGWIGSKTTSVYILDILPAMQKIVKQYPDIKFHLVGFDRSLLSEQDCRKLHIEIIDWTEEDEIKNILTFDVGIMPLYDDPWSRGKCGFKLIQYMSCKKPVVASTTGVNKEIVKNGLNGFLVKTLQEWFDAFEKLYLDKKLRQKMSKNNYTKIENEFNHNKNCENYIMFIKYNGQVM